MGYYLREILIYYRLRLGVYVYGGCLLLAKVHRADGPEMYSTYFTTNKTIATGFRRIHMIPEVGQSGQVLQSRRLSYAIRFQAEENTNRWSKDRESPQLTCAGHYVSQLRYLFPNVC